MLTFTLGSEAPSFLSPFLPPFLSFTETQPKNPSTVSLHHRRRKEWHTAAVRPYLASLVLQVFNPRSLSPIAAASSSSASVVFVCSAALPPPLVAVNVRVFVQPSSSFAFFAVQVCSGFTVRVHSPFTVWSKMIDNCNIEAAEMSATASLKRL
ncbi:hypothetical protein Ahy_B05g075804 [Arachis hypogaea]|uniref:Uncharacterized protein n=1 Tax=Arachis hypogaea TaxID=3818 RepID=A0A444Z216_ARAHY|nr:hypothetical protein Ahy_B05g075804 [Arachis hypogaea]